MSYKETHLSRRIQLKASSMGMRLFRNTNGFCKCRGRRIRYGIASPGGSDLIGWTSDGRFLAVEVKVDSPATKEQKAFIDAVNKSGGIGIIAHSEEDLK